MAYIYLPKEEDNPDFGKETDPGFIEGTGQTLRQSVNFGLTAEAFNLARRGLDESQFLSREDFDKSEYKRPGLNFDSGVHLETARRAAERYDAKQAYDKQMGTINNGFLRGTSQLVGGIAGFGLDPTNLALGIKIPMLVGARAAPFVEGISGTVAQRATQAAIGAGEAAAIVAPQEVASYATDKLYGEDPSIVEPLINIGLAGVLGGAIRGYTGFKEPITRNVDSVAKETAVGQMAAGKSVHVDPLMQHGAYETDVRAKMREAEGAQMRTESAPSPHQELVQLQEELKPLAEAKLEPKIISTLTEQRASEQAKLKDLEESFNQLSDEQKQSAENPIVKAQQDSLDRVRQIDEKLQSHQHALEAEKYLEEIQKHLDVIEGKIVDAKVLRDSAAKLFEPEINKPISSKRLIDGDYNIESLATRAEHPILSRAKERLQNNVAAAMLDAREAKPLTAEQVKAASEHIQSYKSDSTYNHAESESFKSEVDALPDELDSNLEHARTQAENILQDMPDEVKESLAAMNEALGATEKVTNALNKILDCLKGE